MTDVPTFDPWLEELNRQRDDSSEQDHAEGFYSRPELAQRMGLNRSASRFLRMFDRLKAEDRLETREGLRLGSDGRLYPVSVYRVVPKIDRGQEEG
jgi:hypothetical protein